MTNQSQGTSEVAVIVPVHNDSSTLGLCLEAIRPSRGTGWELIVVDDASTDGSGEIARAAGARVIRLPKNAGVSVARNTGAQSTAAEILIFVDADIIPTPGSLAALVDTLVSRPDVHAVGAYPVPGDLSPDWSAHFVGLRSAWGYHWAENETERPFSSIQSECGAMRKSLFLALDGFSEKYGGVGMEEFKMAHDLERRGCGHYLIRGASYRHYYKPLKHRCLILLDRTARWVPLFFWRKKFESRGGFGTWDAAFSALLSMIAFLALAAGFLIPGAWLLAVIFWLAQLLLELPFLRFAKKQYGWPMVLYAFPALQVLQLAIGAGFIWGLIRLPFSRQAWSDLRRG